MSSTLFLRRVLALDALSCAGMGVLLAAAADSLAPLFGLPEGLVRGAGLLLLPVAAFMGGLASRPSPPALLVWVVIVGNLGWVVESFVLVGHYGAAVTAIGAAFVAAQALIVLGLTGLELVGLRRVTPSSASS
ncbi:hypothetical protein [Sphingosinicella humi]|uniref:DUF2069 domain-containing protein n=1 Tax=Allosphingosinicella humi TaxID=2068657 RepID=A0A2U2IZF6_9SPHN|nr:hypothetical protein [Sphingosinicella humi]PWG01458.1 hypothetical protein DF286_00175 [Sphingosinicella humi]